MISNELRFYLTIAEIEGSDSYETNEPLFDKGINLLKERLNSHNFSEFSDNERETLEEIFIKMEE